jgi:hypothetical protein
VPSIRPLPNPDCAAVGGAIDALVIRLHASNAANFTPQAKRFRNCLPITTPSLMAFISLRNLSDRRHVLPMSHFPRLNFYFIRRSHFPSNPLSTRES